MMLLKSNNNPSLAEEREWPGQAASGFLELNRQAHVFNLRVRGFHKAA